MTRIYKYSFVVTDSQQIRVPAGARFLHVGLDPQGVPCLWFLVNPDATPVQFTVFVFGTGHQVPDGVEHLGSFVQGPFVWHVFTNSTHG